MNIINTYDQCIAAGGDRIFIWYVARQPRSCMSSKWVVSRIKDGKEMVTDAAAAWYDYNRKSFTVSGRSDTKTTLAEAIAWANAKYGPREFVRNRMRDYVEKEVNEKFPIPKRSD